MSDTKSMEDIVALCKRRGFIFPASEIYGGINGFWDYGPLGVQLKNNIRDDWWKSMVECPPLGPNGDPLQIVGLDSAIIQNAKVWEASGHVEGFNDPMVDDKATKSRFRADHIYGAFVAQVEEHGAAAQIQLERLLQRIQSDSAFLPEVTIEASSESEAREIFIREKKKVLKNAGKFWKEVHVGNHIADVHFQDREGKTWIAEFKEVGMDRLRDQHETIPSPSDQKTGTLTEPRQFNLMFETSVGALKDDEAKVYLRPETAQGIFLNYKNIVDTMRVKVPFGIAQIGKAFRNEVTPRNFIFRSREFEQMEMEWFCHPSEWEMWYSFWKERRMEWWQSIGIDKAGLKFRDHEPHELSHYSIATVDIEYRYPFTAPGYGELEGIASRPCTEYDLKAHQEHAKTNLEYFDQERNARYLPHVIEPAAGLTRSVLAVICEAFTPTPDRKGSKYILSFAPHVAPIKAGIFPLVNKEGMPEVAQKLYMDLRSRFALQLDAKQSIGKRYARMDEAGTPYCFTVDSQTLEDQTVTVRDRDTASQERIGIDKVGAYLDDKVST